MSIFSKQMLYFSDDDVQGAASGLLQNSSASSAQARGFLREIGFLGQAHLSAQHNPFETDDPEVIYSFSHIQGYLGIGKSGNWNVHFPDRKTQEICQKILKILKYYVFTQGICIQYRENLKF